MRRLAQQATRSAFSGLVPWLPLLLVTSADDLGWALLLAVGLSLASLALTRWVGDRVKNLELIDAVYFVGVGVLALLASPEITDQMARWVTTVSTSLLLVYAAASLVLGRPFTAQYTREIVTPRVQASAEFARTNRIMSGVWVGVLTVQVVTLVLSGTVLGRPDDLLLGWILPIGALAVGFVVDARMTRNLVAGRGSVDVRST